MTIEELQALKVGPDEVLVLKIAVAMDAEEIEQLSAVIKQVGLEGRVMVIDSDEIEMAVVKK